MSERLAATAMRMLVWAGLSGVLINIAPVSAVTIRQLVEVVDIGNVAVSPDGRLVAFRTEQASIERNTYETVWYVQPLDGTMPPRRLGDGGETLRDTGGQSVLEPAVWSSDSRWIFYRVTRHGRIDLWRSAVDGSLTEQVSHDRANVRSFVPGADGRSVDYSVGAARESVVEAEQAEYDGGIHLDASVSVEDTLFRSGLHEGRLATQRRDAVGVFSPLLSDHPDQWRHVDLVTGVTTELVSGNKPVKSLSLADLPAATEDATSLAVEPSGKRVAVLANAGKSPTGQPWYELSVLPDRLAKKGVTCTADLCLNKTMTDIVWRPGTDEVVFTVTDRDHALDQALYRWNVESGTVAPIAQARGQLSGGGRFFPGPCGASASVLVCVTASADMPPRLERVDIGTGARSVLAAPNALLAQDMQGLVRDFDWIDPKGRHVTGRYYPAARHDDRPPPLFVAYYRCAGFVRGGLGDEWPLATLAQKGVASLCLNALPLDEDAVVRYSEAVAAIQGAVGQLAGSGQIDPGRVGLGGLSYGAEVSFWASWHANPPLTISVSTPVMSPLAWTMFSLAGDPEIKRIQRYWQAGSPQETPERWEHLLSPSKLDTMQVPILMQMSEQEFRDSLEYTIPLIRRHRGDVYVFPDEQHQKFQPRHKLAVYQRNLDWFRFWLLGEQDPSPGKVDQYRQWLQMKSALVKPSSHR